MRGRLSISKYVKYLNVFLLLINKFSKKELLVIAIVTLITPMLVFRQAVAQM